MTFTIESIAVQEEEPHRIVIHGEPGVGKTTFAASAPNPVFIRTEDGLGRISAPTFPKITSYAEMMDAITVLIQSEHGFSTVVIDSLDWFEPMVWRHVCETWTDGKGNQKRLASIEDAGYGKGYIEADGYWDEFIKATDYLRLHRGMIVIMIAHTTKVRIQNPMLPEYDRYDLKLHKRAAAKVSEFADIILFAQQHTATTKDGRGEDARVRATSNGKRIMHTVGQPAFLAKNRYSLPPELPLSWDAFSNAMWGG